MLLTLILNTGININGLRPTHIIIDDPIIRQGNIMKITHERHTDNANSIKFSVGTYALFSYETLVAFYDGRNEYIDECKYSRTTSKHISQYSNPRHAQETHYISQRALQDKLQTYMANHVIKNVLGEVI